MFLFWIKKDSRKSIQERLYNLGIAEQNMVGVAGGLAKEGFIPFVSTYASFCSSRCADQVRVNMSYMKLPIKMLGLTAGYGAGYIRSDPHECRRYCCYESPSEHCNFISGRLC